MEDHSQDIKLEEKEFVVKYFVSEIILPVFIRGAECLRRIAFWQ